MVRTYIRPLTGVPGSSRPVRLARAGVTTRYPSSGGHSRPWATPCMKSRTSHPGTALGCGATEWGATEWGCGGPKPGFLAWPGGFHACGPWDDGWGGHSGWGGCIQWATGPRTAQAGAAPRHLVGFRPGAGLTAATGAPDA